MFIVRLEVSSPLIRLNPWDMETIFIDVFDDGFHRL